METWLQIFSQSCVLSLMLSVIRQITTFSTRYQALMHRDTETWCTEEEISGRSCALQNITMWHLSYSCFKWFQGASHIPARDNLPGVITPATNILVLFFWKRIHSISAAEWSFALENICCCGRKAFPFPFKGSFLSSLHSLWPVLAGRGLMEQWSVPMLQRHNGV